MQTHLEEFLWGMGEILFLFEQWKTLADFNKYRYIFNCKYSNFTTYNCQNITNFLCFYHHIKNKNLLNYNYRIIDSQRSWSPMMLSGFIGLWKIPVSRVKESKLTLCTASQLEQPGPDWPSSYHILQWLNDLWFDACSPILHSYPFTHHATQFSNFASCTQETFI